MLPLTPGAARRPAAVPAGHRRAPRRHRDRRGRTAAAAGRPPAAGSLRPVDRHRGTAGRGPRRGHRLPARRGPDRRAVPAARGSAARGLGAGEGDPRAGGAVAARPMSSSRRPSATRTRTTVPIGEIVPTVFRDQLCLAYEIPKWDGDLGRPSLYVPLSAGDRPAQGRTAAQVLPVAAWPGLVGRRGVPRPGPAARHGVPRPVRRGVQLCEITARAGRPARRGRDLT